MKKTIRLLCLLLCLSACNATEPAQSNNDASLDESSAMVEESGAVVEEESEVPPPEEQEEQKDSIPDNVIDIYSLYSKENNSTIRIDDTYKVSPSANYGDLYFLKLYSTEQNGLEASLTIRDQEKSYNIDFQDIDGDFIKKVIADTITRIYPSSSSELVEETVKALANSSTRDDISDIVHIPGY